MILVTGGNGSIGKIFCQKLCSQGEDVLSCSRSKYDTNEYKHIQADITDKERLEEIFENYEVSCVVHLSSMLMTISNKQPDQAVRVNVLGSLNLLDICKDKKIRFVYGSSINAIGRAVNVHGNNRIKEVCDCIPEDFYGQTKRFVEITGIKMSEVYNFEFVTVRIPTIVGYGQGSKNSAWREHIFTKINTSEKIYINFSSDQYIPFLHVNDTAEVLSKFVYSLSFKNKIYNLPCYSLQIKQLIEMIKELGSEMFIETGDAKPVGTPAFINFDRFEEEFDYNIKSIKERLEEQIKTKL
jgi:nucleoside-diphosphate-sugar epimerase